MTPHLRIYNLMKTHLWGLPNVLGYPYDLDVKTLSANPYHKPMSAW